MMKKMKSDSSKTYFRLVSENHPSFFSISPSMLEFESMLRCLSRREVASMLRLFSDEGVLKKEA